MSARTINVHDLRPGDNVGIKVEGEGQLRWGTVKGWCHVDGESSIIVDHGDQHVSTSGGGYLRITSIPEVRVWPINAVVSVKAMVTQ